MSTTSKPSWQTSRFESTAPKTTSSYTVTSTTQTSSTSYTTSDPQRRFPPPSSYTFSSDPTAGSVQNRFAAIQNRSSAPSPNKTPKQMRPGEFSSIFGKDSSSPRHSSPKKSSPKVSVKESKADWRDTYGNSSKPMTDQTLFKADEGNRAIRQATKEISHENCKDAFETYKQSEGGVEYLDQDSFEFACAYLGVDYQDYTDGFKELDANGNGKLEFVEFIKVLLFKKRTEYVA